MTEQTFIEELAKYNINPNSEQLDLLRKYYQLIIEYNEHTNITSITNKEDVYLKHFYDSLTSMFFINYLPNKTLLDIGSGAGLPGIVLKIFNPSLNITLLDSNNKKTTFLNEVISKLNLKNIKVVNKRSEEYIINNRENYDYVIGRAVKELNVLAELSMPFVTIGGYFIIMKGIYNEEIINSSHVISALGGEIINIDKFKMPDNSERTIIIVKKKKKSNPQYPRNYSKILKNPLK